MVNSVIASKAKQSEAQYITAQHIRLFILKLRETNSPVSVGDYYKATKRQINSSA